MSDETLFTFCYTNKRDRAVKALIDASNALLAVASELLSEEAPPPAEPFAIGPMAETDPNLNRQR